MGKKHKKKTLASTRKSQQEAVDKKNRKKKLKLNFQEVKEKAKEAKTEVIAATRDLLKPRHERKKLSPEQKQKIRGGILSMIGLFALVFIGWFLFGKFFKAEAIGNFLTANDTAGIIELNTDTASNQTKLFMQTLNKYPAYQSENLTALINRLTGMNFHQDIEPWLGRKVGIALTDNLQKIYFVESIDHNKTLNFLNNKTMAVPQHVFTQTEYRGYKLYQFEIGKKFIGTFFNNYFVFTDRENDLQAEETTPIKIIIDRYLSSQLKLTGDENYQKVINNLPQGALVFAFVNYQKLYNALTNDPRISTGKASSIIPFKPYLDLFAAEGVSIFSDKGRFVIQSFTAVNKKVLDNQSLITFNEKYRGDLLNLANEEAILFIGGHDLSKELGRFGEIFQSSTQTSSLIFNGLIEAQKDRYFGKDFSLKDDIYPLLHGEYLVTVENNFEKPFTTFLIELNDKTNDIVKVEKLISAFVKTGGVFSPRIQSVTLPDGTKGQEVVASPEKIERIDEKYGSTNITVLKIGNTGISIYLAVIRNSLVVSTNPDSLHKIIDRSEGKVSTNLSTSNFFNKNIKPILQSADEVINVKIGALSDILGLTGNQLLATYLLPFANLTATKNYFSDGISTIYLIEVI